jgi:hypothetical protein
MKSRPVDESKGNSFTCTATLPARSASAERAERSPSSGRIPARNGPRPVVGEECWDAGSMAPGCVVKAVGDLGPLAMRAGDSRDSAGWRRAQKRVQVRRRITDAPAGQGRRGSGVHV